jgi:hypothetical protein
MKFLSSLFSLVSVAVGLCASARADLIEQFVVPAQAATPCTWFQALSPGGTALTGHSGVMNLGTMPFGTVLAGGWLSFTPQGTFVTYVGGGTSTREVLTPAGASISDVRGAMNLSEAYGAIVDTNTGLIIGVTLYAGAILWTPGHTYLLLVGGIPTIYEFTVGGAPIAGVRGGSRLGANVIDTDPGIGVAATLFSGAVVYTSTQTFLLTTFGLGIGATELMFGGASIGGVRGVTAMGGNASTVMLDSGSFLWTSSKVLMLVTGLGTSVTEVLDPGGASIARTWGITRQSPLYLGGGAFQGLATIINDAKEFVVLASGGLTIAEVMTPAGASLRSSVVSPASNTLLHQASGLSEIFASWAPPSGGSARGTVIGALQ